MPATEDSMDLPAHPLPEADIPPILLPMTDEMDIPLMIISVDAVTTMDPEEKNAGKAKTIPAYEITFKTVVPEKFAASIILAANSHRLLVHVKGNGLPDLGEEE